MLVFLEYLFSPLIKRKRGLVCLFRFYFAAECCSEFLGVADLLWIPTCGFSDVDVSLYF